MRDEDLITAHLAGDLDAGDTLARRYYVALLDYFRLRVPDDEVEELTQHTLLHTIARCDRFRRASSFRHYVYAVARRVVAERHRRCRRRPDFDDACDEAPADDTSPSAHVARDQRRARLEDAVLELRSPFRTVVRLHLDGLDNLEIAAALGIPKATVRSRLSRATSALRRALLPSRSEGVPPRRPRLSRACETPARICR